MVEECDPAFLCAIAGATYVSVVRFGLGQQHSNPYVKPFPIPLLFGITYMVEMMVLLITLNLLLVCYFCQNH